jgi:hypothetical protein
MGNVFRRTEIQAVDGVEFLGEMGIVADLEVVDAMRLQSMRTPDVPTLDSEILISRAIVLRDQCVAPTGLLCVVFATT